MSRIRVCLKTNGLGGIIKEATNLYLNFCQDLCALSCMHVEPRGGDSSLAGIVCEPIAGVQGTK